MGLITPDRFYSTHSQAAAGVITSHENSFFLESERNVKVKLREIQILEKKTYDPQRFKLKQMIHTYMALKRAHFHLSCDNIKK